MKWFHFLNASVSTPQVSARGSSSIVATKPANYPKLNSLPKAPAIRSIRFKRTTPGIAARLLQASVAASLVDPSHPLGSLSPQRLRQARVLPQYNCSLFVANAYPHALLNRVEDPQFFKQLKGRGVSSEMDDVLDAQTPKGKCKDPVDLAQGELPSKTSGDRRREKHTLPMSLIFTASKKKLHKSAIVRNKVKQNFKDAVSLVAIRGATAENGTGAPGERKILLKTPEGLTEENIRDLPILQGWIYIIRPSLELYRCPWPLLLDHVSKALVNIKSQAVELERKWRAGNIVQPSSGSNNQSLGAKRPPKTKNNKEPRKSIQRESTDTHLPHITADTAPRLETLSHSRRPPRDPKRQLPSLTPNSRGSTYSEAKVTASPHPARNTVDLLSSSSQNRAPLGHQNFQSEAKASRGHRSEPAGSLSKSVKTKSNGQDRRHRGTGLQSHHSNS